MFRRINFKNDPMDGIVHHIKNQSGVDNIIESKYAEIIVSSMRTEGNVPSSDPEVIFGIGNEDYSKCWVSENNNPIKYLFLKFKHSMMIDGIGIANYEIDWYAKYTLNYSNDFIT